MKWGKREIVLMSGQCSLITGMIPQVTLQAKDERKEIWIDRQLVGEGPIDEKDNLR